MVHMDKYTFGGSRWIKFRSRIVGTFVWSGCSVSRFFVWIARRVNKLSVRWARRSAALRERAEPTTIHISKIVPLDKWTMRIEFTVDRKERWCLHLHSMLPIYTETFASYKRGEEVEIEDVHYYSVSGQRNEWKKM